MRLHGKPDNLEEDLSSFKKEVANEIAIREKNLHTIQMHRPWDAVGHLVSIALISIMIFLIFQQYSVLILWLFIAILLYSYNFVILFIPTTTRIIRPDDKEFASTISKERKWFAVKLLIKNRKLAIEIGLTVLMGGIIPLNLSFSVIFGIGLFFTAYFGIFSHFIADQTMIFIVIQITLIMLFFVMMLIIKPQTQGFTKIARSFKTKLKVARSKGRGAFLIVILSMIGVISVAGVLVFGAMVLPGFLLQTLYNDLNLFSNIDIPMIILVFASQLLVMRHFQVLISRRIAVKRSKERLAEMKMQVLVKLDELESEQERDVREAKLEDLKGRYYSIAIYDIIRHDVFGHFPVYLVGLRLRYVLDEDVIEHINAISKSGHEPNQKLRIIQGPNVRWKISFRGTKRGTISEVRIPDPPHDKKK